MFTAALFTIARTWKQTRCPSTDKGIKKMWYLYLLFSLSVVSDSANPWTVVLQTSQSFIISRSLLKHMSVESMMPSNHLILCCPLLFLPSIFSFPASGSFPMSPFFALGGQSIGASASASVLPMNIQVDFL